MPEPIDRTEVIATVWSMVGRDLGDLRLGQAIFNAAFVKWPGAANRVQGTDADCFFNDERIDAFFVALTNELNRSEE